ncbi:MAG: ribonuclease P protein component [Oscillospiraceae bacterium]|nr:ribonuclease P protein component [Oscillospiraceae bacterium]
MSDFVTLKENTDFRRLYNRGKAIINPALVIYYSKNRAGICRIGITASKKVGNAVERNRSRRVIKEAFRNIAKEIEPCFDFVLVARSKTKHLKSTHIENVLRDTLKNEGLLKSEGELK